MQTGEQQRRTERWPPETVLILRYKEGVIERKCAVELAVLCTCMSELEEEYINLEDTMWRLVEMLQRAKEGQYRCILCSEACALSWGMRASAPRVICEV